MRMDGSIFQDMEENEAVKVEKSGAVKVRT
jgi:hypothetical protein